MKYAFDNGHSGRDYWWVFQEVDDISAIVYAEKHLLHLLKGDEETMTCFLYRVLEKEPPGRDIEVKKWPRPAKQLVAWKTDCVDAADIERAKAEIGDGFPGLEPGTSDSNNSIDSAKVSYSSVLIAFQLLLSARHIALKTTRSFNPIDLFGEKLLVDEIVKIEEFLTKLHTGMKIEVE